MWLCRGGLISDAIDSLWAHSSALADKDRRTRSPDPRSNYHIWCLHTAFALLRLTISFRQWPQWGQLRPHRLTAVTAVRRREPAINPVPDRKQEGSANASRSGPVNLPTGPRSRGFALPQDNRSEAFMLNLSKMFGVP